MFNSATIDKFNDTLASMDKNVLMQTSFLESIYNMVVPISVAIDTMNNNLSELLNLEKQRFEFEKENQEDLDRERQLRDVEPPASDTTRDVAGPADIVEDEKDSGFGLPGIGLKTLLLGAAAAPLIWSFLKGLVQQLLEDWWKRVQQWFNETIKDFKAWFESTLNDLKEFLNSLIPPWARPDKLADIPLNQREAAAAAIAKQEDATAAALTQRANELEAEGRIVEAADVRRMAAAATQRANAARASGAAAKDRIKLEDFLSKEQDAMMEAATGGSTDETPPATASEVPEVTPAPIGNFAVGTPATDAISTFLQNQDPDSAPMPGDPLTSDHINTIKNKLEELNTNLDYLKDVIDEYGGLDVLKDNPEWESTLEEYNALIAEQRTLTELLNSSRETLENTLQELRERRQEILDRIDVLDAQEPYGIVDNPANQQEYNNLMQELRDMPLERMNLPDIGIRLNPASFEGSTRIIDRINVISQETAKLMSNPRPVVLLGGSSTTTPINNVDNSQHVVNNYTIDPRTNLNSIPV